MNPLQGTIIGLRVRKNGINFQRSRFVIHSIIRATKARMNPKRRNRKVGTRPCKSTKAGLRISANFAWREDGSTMHWIGVGKYISCQWSTRPVSNILNILSVVIKSNSSLNLYNWWFFENHPIYCFLNTLVDKSHIVSSFWIWPMLSLSSQKVPLRKQHYTVQFGGSLLTPSIEDLVCPLMSAKHTSFI